MNNGNAMRRREHAVKTHHLHITLNYHRAIKLCGGRQWGFEQADVRHGGLGRVGRRRHRDGGGGASQRAQRRCQQPRRPAQAASAARVERCLPQSAVQDQEQRRVDERVDV